MSDLISGSEILMQSLLKEGVETIFGYPGGAITPVFDALYDFQDKFNFIPAKMTLFLVFYVMFVIHRSFVYGRSNSISGCG